MMDAAVVDGNLHQVRERNVVELQVETDDEVRTGNEQTSANDVPPSSLYPLITSMKLFGIYFTRDAVRVTPAATSQPGRRRRLGWNSARVYATVLLAVTWLNAVRSCIIFNGKDTFGAELLRKIGTIPGVLLIAFLHTTYYVASHTGSLNFIFREIKLSADNCSVKLRRKTKILTVVCWLLMATGTSYYILMFTREQSIEFAAMLIIKAFRLSKIQAGIMQVFFSIVQLPATACWTFTQAMKHVFLTYQKHCLFKIFRHCLSPCRVFPKQLNLESS